MLTESVGQEFRQGINRAGCFCHTGMTSIKAVTSSSRFRGRELKLHLLMGEWQDHTVEEHMKQEIFLQPPLKNAICYTMGVIILTKF